MPQNLNFVLEALSSSPRLPTARWRDLIGQLFHVAQSEASLQVQDPQKSTNSRLAMIACLGFSLGRAKGGDGTFLSFLWDILGDSGGNSSFQNSEIFVFVKPWVLENLSDILKIFPFSRGRTILHQIVPESTIGQLTVQEKYNLEVLWWKSQGKLLEEALNPKIPENHNLGEYRAEVENFVVRAGLSSLKLPDEKNNEWPGEVWRAAVNCFSVGRVDWILESLTVQKLYFLKYFTS